MSKQVSLSALVASLAMALVSLAAAHGLFAGEGAHLAAGAPPLFTLTVTR